jgi:hypothetical protein
MRARQRAAIVGAVVATIALPALPASAAPLPETVLKIRSIDWQPRSGDVEVAARVKCTGKGTFRWEVGLEQNRVKDRGSANVPCDGDGYRSTIVLDPRTGRFHPGAAQLMRGAIICGSDACIGFQVLEQTRISPPGHAHRGAR